MGTHTAISPGALLRFLERFEQVYGNLGKADWIISTAAAHHRLLWMHPFMDANGRVARLMSHAMLPDILDTGAVWSVARGLARNVQQYKTLAAVLYRGELPRSDVATVAGAGERQARRIVAALIQKEVLISDSPRAPLRLAFPATLAARWMPGLFPEHPA